MRRREQPATFTSSGPPFCTRETRAGGRGSGEAGLSCPPACLPSPEPTRAACPSACARSELAAHPLHHCLLYRCLKLLPNQPPSALKYLRPRPTQPSHTPPCGATPGPPLPPAAGGRSARRPAACAPGSIVPCSTLPLWASSPPAASAPGCLAPPSRALAPCRQWWRCCWDSCWRWGCTASSSLYCCLAR